MSSIQQPRSTPRSPQGTVDAAMLARREGLACVREEDVKETLGEVKAELPGEDWKRAEGALLALLGELRKAGGSR